MVLREFIQTVFFSEIRLCTPEPSFQNLSFEERLKECCLTTIATRRLRGDQIEVLKILNGYKNIYRYILSHSRKGVELNDMT